MKKGKKQDTRNFHAIAPIMRKGGVHEKPYRVARAAKKRELKKLQSLSEGEGSPFTGFCV